MRRFGGAGRGRVWWLLGKVGLLLGVVGGCGSEGTGGRQSSEEAEIAVDATLRPAVEAVVELFERTYPRSRLRVYYVPQEEAVSKLLADSLSAVVVCRPFAPAESLGLAEEKIRPKQTQVAWDGIAVVGHPARPDSLLRVDSLKAWLSREKSPYLFVVEAGGGSSVYRYVRDSLLQGHEPRATLYRLDSLSAILQFVQQNARALGLMGASWICNTRDSVTQDFVRSVRVFWIAAEGSQDYYPPHAGYIRPGYYAFIRPVWALSREPRVGPATKFIAYLAGPEGQRILLKAGLFPVRAPVRVIELKEQPIQ